MSTNTGPPIYFSSAMGFLARFVALAGAFHLLPSSTALTFGFPYGSQKVRGVNLGGWLVLEVGYHLHFLLCLTCREALDHPLHI